MWIFQTLRPGGKRFRLLWSLVGLCGLLLLAVVFFFHMAAPSLYCGPDDAFSVRYPRPWEPQVSGGVVTFLDKDRQPGAGGNVTIVVSKTKPGWADEFEPSLRAAFDALGSDYRLQKRATAHFAAGTTEFYFYTVTLGGKQLANVVYVFDIGLGKAAVMTCSAPQGQEEWLQETCRTFAQTLRVPAEK